MISQIQLIAFSLAYLSLLFVIAYLGDRINENVMRKIKPMAIGFGVTIYCSAWSFYGTTAQAADNGWYFPPTFLGTIILLVFCAPLLRKLINESKRTNITSLADYLAVSFGRSRTLAVLITLVSVALLIPYIALQLKAITHSYQILGETGVVGESSGLVFDTAFYVALILAIFALAFGTRHLDSREHHNGLMLAIAFEAIVKITAFMILAWYVSYIMFDGIEDIFIKVAQSDSLSQLIEQRRDTNNGYTTALVLGLIATICLPRQFHVMVVESESSRDFDTVRWLFCGYLIIFGLCMLPMAYAGLSIFEGTGISSEAFVQRLSMVGERTDLALLTYIGGLSAGSSMVIVACVAMSTMACNELVVPLLLKTRWFNIHGKKDLSHLLRTIRRLIILVLMFLAYVYYQVLANNSALGAIGLLSFSLVAQFAPSVAFSVLLKAERRANLANAAIAGLAAGFVLWFYTLLIPSMVRADLIGPSILENGLFGLAWLTPNDLFGLGGLGELTHGVVLSLAANILCFMYFSKNPKALFSDSSLRKNQSVFVDDLRRILARFLGTTQAELVLKQYEDLSNADGVATEEHIQTIENILSGVIGSVSARYVIEHLLMGERGDEDVLEKTSEIFHFGRDLLQESIDSISQGISVLDKQQCVVAWNRSYQEMFNYPAGVLHVGRHISDLVRFSGEANNIHGEELDSLVEKRLKLIAAGKTYKHNYIHNDGRVLEIQGSPMAGGGFVTTFTDITAYQQTLGALEETRANLESRVKERTEELQQVNRQLRQANHNKTHFLAAAGHDLMQPLSAAKLFVMALTQRKHDADTLDMLSNLDRALHSADTIISELLAIAKLDSGEMRVNPHVFCIGDLLDGLYREFSIIAEKKGVVLKWCHTELNIKSDDKLLKRVLQNLLSNAIRYTDNGKVLIGCRRTDTKIYIDVVDTGCGIPESEKDSIFTEFHRLDKSRHDGGLGLGLATVQRLCQLLNVRIEVDSVVGSGSRFRIVMPRTDVRQKPTLVHSNTELVKESALAGMKILCIDNERSIVDGMQVVLEPWDCVFHGETALTFELPWVPDVILVDYHLDNDISGIDVAQTLCEHFSKQIPVVVISADQDNNVRVKAGGYGYYFLRKPLKVASLWSVLTRIQELPSSLGLKV